MSAPALALVAVVLALLLATVKPLGLYIAAVMEGRQVWIVRLGAPLERCLYRCCGTDPRQEMGWRSYALALLTFNTAGVVVVYALQRLQGWLPLNPQALGAVSPSPPSTPP